MYPENFIAIALAIPVEGRTVVKVADIIIRNTANKYITLALALG